MQDDMPLYEIVLRFPDREAEVRLTDRALVVGERIVIANRNWDVVLERKPANADAAAGFLCEPSRERRGRAIAARANDARLSERS